MVGVPRSKGCKTCRRKKRKCDEQKPRCGQCQEASRECEGYEQTTIFLNSSTGDFDSTAPSSRGGGSIRFKNQFANDITWQNAHRHSGGGGGGEHHNVTADIQSGGGVKAAAVVARPSKKHSFRVEPYAAGPRDRQVSSTTKSRPRPLTAAAATPPIPAPRRPLATRIWAIETILSQFLEICLPFASTQEAPLAWIKSLVPMKKEVDALPLAMSALAFGWAGHVNHQPQLVDKGLQLYSAAVQQLRSDLDTCSPLQMLAVAALFVEFELCEFGSQGNTGWQTHMQGIAALLRSFGPDMVSAEPFVQIYSFVRIIFITRGLSQRKRVCASAPMWRQDPFKNYKKNSYHKFYDIASEACELLERADALSIRGTTATTTTSASPLLPDPIPIAENADGDRPTDVFRDIIDIINRLKELKRAEKMSSTPVIGPASFPDASSAASNRLLRATARGYPVKIPAERQSQWTFDAIQGQRLVHTYWALLLNLCMTVLENCHLRTLLFESYDDDIAGCGLRNQFLAALGIPPPNPPSSSSSDTTNKNNNTATIDLVTQECRKLANDIAIYGTLTCHNMCQSFGSLISVTNLETAVRWYENNNNNNNNTNDDNTPSSASCRGPTMETALEEHCRALLRGIRDEEAKEPRAFDVAVLPEDVLRCAWC